MPEIELKVGDVHELVLRGLGTAGYSWDTDLAGPEGVLEIRRVSSGPGPTAEPGGPPPPGVSLPVVLQLVALREGRVKVRLTLHRRWETGVPPLEEDELDVVVTAVPERHA